MVTVTNFKTVETDEGSYIRLILKGDLEMIFSEKSGNYYAHTKVCSISSTFDEATAKLMIGKTLPGSIIRQEVEPYQMEVNGELMTLKHKWVYTSKSQEDLAVDNLVDEINSSAKQNGTKEAVAA